MFIEAICISGFKNYKETVIYNFSDFSQIEGKNAQGKTSIAEAIVWGLYGCDLSGDTKADSKLRNIESEEMYVILDFHYNGQSNRIVRKKSKSLTLKFNDERISEGELAKHLPNKELFLSIFNSKYFLSYNIAKQRKLLLEMLPKIRPSDIFEKFNSEDITYILEKFNSPNDALNHYSSLIKNKKQLINDKETEINVFNNLIIEQSNPIPEVEVFTEEDKELLNNLQKLYANNGKNIETLPTINLQMQINNLNTEINIESNKEFKSSNKRYIEDLNISLAQLVGESNSLTNIYSKLLSCDSVCPTCGQAINQEHRDKELNEIAENLSSIDTEQQALQSSISLLENIDLDNKKNFQLTQNEKINKLKEDLSNLNRQLAEINKTNMAIEKSINENNSELIERINNLKNKQMLYTQYLTALKNQNDIKQSYVSKIEKATSEIIDINNTILSLEIEYQKLKSYNSLYVQYIGEILSSWLNRVSINLFTIVKSTGEIKDTFEVKFDNKDLRLVSNSEYTKTGLEISDMFNKSLNIALPIFVDDAESIIDIPKLQTQMIVAKVNDCDLTIKNHSINVAETEVINTEESPTEVNYPDIVSDNENYVEQLCF